MLAHRPHLVLDGAMVAAHAIGSTDVVVYLHRSRGSASAALLAALAERTGDVAAVRLVDAPSRYVAGESSAVVSYLQGTGAIPRRRAVPAAAFGVSGRPTVVNNVETIAHLGLIARRGADWFVRAGDPRSPGSTLLTLAGEVVAPGMVVESLSSSTTIGAVLESYGQVDRIPRAVLVGGYEGTWLDGATAWRTPLNRGALSSCGASLGCGVLAVVRHGSCGLETTADLVRWLTGESAGQCGPCVIGLPAIADLLEALAHGGSDKRAVRRLRLLTESVNGRGACGHPSGVAALVDSALDTFADEIDRHARGARCAHGADGFPVPRREVPWS